MNLNDIKYIKVEIPTLFGDSQIPYDFPLRKYDQWHITIDVNNHTILDWPKNKAANVVLKVFNYGVYFLLDREMKEISILKDKYAPNKLLPGISNASGYYINLEIDEKGKILNWYNEPSYVEFYNESPDRVKTFSFECERWKSDLFLSLLMNDGGDGFSDVEISEAQEFLQDNMIYSMCDRSEPIEDNVTCNFAVHQFQRDSTLHNQYDSKPYGSYRLKFVTSIKNIDNTLFAHNRNCRNLKEWVNGFESTYFIQTTPNSAIITSGHMIEYVVKWLHGFELLKEVMNLEINRVIFPNRYLEDIDFHPFPIQYYWAVKIKLNQSVQEINHSHFGTQNNRQTRDLKEWIDSYERSRYTELDSHNIIITSEYNVECILESLYSYGFIDTLKYIYGEKIKF